MWLKILCIAALLFLFLITKTYAQAFSGCTSDVYIAQNSPTALYRVDTSTNPFAYPQIGATSSFTYNAIAFNPADNYIYGVAWNNSTRQVNLLRIASTGSVTNLGAITGAGINSNGVAPASGEIGADGYYYLKFNTPGTGGGVLYRVNLSNLSSTTATTLSRNLPSADLAWYNGALYSHNMDNGTVYKINPATGAVTIVGPSGILSAFGAIFSASNGIFAVNNNGGFYQLNPSTGKATLISSSPASNNNDGAKCFSTPLVFGADLAITKTDNRNFYIPGSTTTYTMVVSNSGPFGVEEALVNDALPTGISTASWTCVAGLNGGTCGVASGTGGISSLPVDLPPNGTVTLTMTVAIPASYTGNLTNTVTVTPPNTASDADPSNNSATDIDAGITIAKSLFAESGTVANAAEPGETLTYHVTLTNTSTVAVSDYDATDRLDANTTFVSADNGGTATSGLVTWSGLSLPANGSLVLTVVATVNDPLPATTVTLTNIAYATGQPDPPCPSTQCVVTPVVGKIAITKQLLTESGTQAGIAEPGETLTYRIRLSNSGGAATGYNLVDEIDANVAFVSADNGGVETGGQINWTNLNIPAASGGTSGVLDLTVVVTVNNPLPIGVLTIQNLARATTEPDPPCPSLQCVVTPTTGKVTITKTLVEENGFQSGLTELGETLIYHITLTNTGGVDVVNYDVDDVLDVNLEFVSTDHGGVLSGRTISWTNLTVPAQGPATSNSVVLTVVARVANPLPPNVTELVNLAKPSGEVDPPCPSIQCVITPVAPRPVITYAKSANASQVQIGDVVTYTVVVNITGADTNAPITLTDILGTGLTFGTVTQAGAFNCNTQAPLICTLPSGTGVGTYSLSYTASVNAQASDMVRNAVVGTGDDNPVCASVCTTELPVILAEVSYSKTADTAGPVRPGDVITYTLTTTVANAQTTSDVVLLTDTLGTGLTFGQVLSAGAYQVDTSGAPVARFTLPAGTTIGSYAVTYTATVNAQATEVVRNAVVGSGGDNPVCTTNCGTEIPVAPVVTYGKIADAAQVKVGDMVTYTLHVTVADASTTGIVTLTDTPGVGLTFNAVTDTGIFSCNGQEPLACTLPAGTAIGTFSLTYTATVNSQASGSVRNAVVGSGDDTPTCASLCTTDLPVINPEVSYAKTADTAGPVKVGDVITYTLTTTVANAQTTSDVVLLTDTLGTGLTFGQVLSAGAYQVDTSGAPVARFTLPAGIAAGTYSVTYTAAVNAQATESVKNAVVGSGGDNPVCTTDCGTEIPIEPVVTYGKVADAAQVKVGDLITYTLSVTVADASTTGAVTLTDTLGTGLTFNAVTDAGAFGCNAQNPLVCALPTGTAIGTYSLSYTAFVNAQASGSVRNAVVGSGDDAPTCANLCTTDLPVINPEVSYSKTADTAGPVRPGDVITYTLTTTVANAQTTSDVVLLTDTLGTGLTFGQVLNAGAYQVDSASSPIERFSLPAGTAAGTYSVTYTAIVNGQASDTVRNAVIGTGGDDPLCTTDCDTEIPVAPVVTYGKVADAAQVKVGDTVTYTLHVTVADASTTGIVTLTDTLGVGLTFNTVTDAGAFTCSVQNPLVCTLPAGTGIGTYTLTYTAAVNAQASGSVTNAVVADGNDDPACTASCDTEQPVISPEVSYAKTANTAGPVKVGDVITYTLTTTVANAQTTSAVVLLTDTLGTGLTFGQVLNAGEYQVDISSAPIARFTLPGGKGPGTYSITYTAVVNTQAANIVQNAVVGSGGDNPVCTTDCGTEIPIEAVVTYAKSANATQVQIGDLITYTLTVTVADANTSGVVTLTDTLGTGLTFGDVAYAGAFTCNDQAPLVCTLPAGSAIGTYNLTYTATVNPLATGAVRNAVVATGDDNPTCAAMCTTEQPVIAPEVSYAKIADTTGPVKVGDVITYTLTTVVASGTTTTDIVLLTDTLGTGLTFGRVVNAGDYQADISGAPVGRFTLPAGKGPGTYEIIYTATVNDQASGSVRNAVVASGGDNPTCTANCGTDIPVDAAAVTYSKTASTAGPVRIGDLITYTLTVTVTNTATAGVVTLTDTLGTGLTFRAVTRSGAFTCSAQAPLICTLPASTAIGTYSVTYTATVNAQALEAVKNTVIGTGLDEPACANTCSTEAPLAQPVVSIAKSADVGDGSSVQIGQSIRFTLTANISEATITDPVVLTDTPDAGFTLSNPPDGCELRGASLSCTLPAGTAVGDYTFTYIATVNAGAGATVNNQVTATGGGGNGPTCAICSMSYTIEQPKIRLSKGVAVRTVNIGDLVRYTLTVENVGDKPLVNGHIDDTPPAGFSYVAGSLHVSGDDTAATATGQIPVRFDGVDVAPGKTIVLVYLMRVGAGVRPGPQINQALTYDSGNHAISNPASAQVELVADPLLDDSLIFGTVFDDRDGDGWQDSAALTGLHASGGFPLNVYVPGSTSVRREAVNSPALLSLPQGMNLGKLPGRQSDADPSDQHEIIIRQFLSAPTFDDSFTLIDQQGFTIRMDAAGRTRVETTGEAAKGLSSAAPSVERKVEPSEAGYVVDYIISNIGVDERGIPGVRIASAEGLRVETDPYGRYHIAGISGGSWERGRNFILKVDPATLPEGARLTTPNPLVRRITPGLPTRFDWGIKLPPAIIAGGATQVQLELGSIIFSPGSAEISPTYLPSIDKVADKVLQFKGGEIVIDSEGENEALALKRAEAVRIALIARLDAASAQQLVVTVREHVDTAGSTVIALSPDGLSLGTILFATDKADILPRFDPLLNEVAATIERAGGGVITIVGHTDVRGSFTYNSALGMRRAQAVQEALIRRLSPEFRDKVRVESGDPPPDPATTSVPSAKEEPGS